MDKSIKIIMALGIALIYPLVIYFTVITVLPEPKKPERNTSTCIESDDYRYGKRCSDYSYDYDYNYSQSSYKEQDKLTAHRADVALIIGTISIVIMFFLRKEKEIAAGIIAGSAITVFSAMCVSLGASFGSDEQYEKLLASILSIISFIVITVVIYGLEFMSNNNPELNFSSVSDAATPPPPTQTANFVEENQIEPPKPEEHHNKHHNHEHQHTKTDPDTESVEKTTN